MSGRIDIDVENSAVEDVRRCAAERIEAARAERDDRATTLELTTFTRADIDAWLGERLDARARG